MIASKRLMRENADKNILAYCPVCGSEYSADYSDYFMQGDQWRMTCCNGVPCELVIKTVSFNHLIPKYGSIKT